MTLNLLTDQWIPVRRADGTTATIAPWELVPPEDASTAPPVDIIPPRADFRAALHEFCIGLLQVTLRTSLRTVSDWENLLLTPPSQSTLQEAFAEHVQWFNLLGERPLFMQDLTLPEPGNSDKTFPVSSLLIDAPGLNAINLNTDHFVKRDRTDCLCPACAAMALYTLQAFAPSGGAGNRVSLRGGGPLSTLAVPSTINGAPATLWHTLWANVLPLSQYQSGRITSLPGDVYPWGAPTRTSEKGEITSPANVHTYQCYWGMPRRILLLPQQETTPATCSLCGAQTTTVVRHFAQRPSGTNYGPTWKHPLTPYRFQKNGVPALPIKGNPGITGYVNWLGMVYGEGTEAGNMERARCVKNALETPTLNGAVLIRASGYDMDNMKARQWCEGQYPVFTIAEARLEDFRTNVKQLVKDADTVKKSLLGALKSVIFSEKVDASVDKSVFHGHAATYWGSTESMFYDMVQRYAASTTATAQSTDESPPRDPRVEWINHLIKQAKHLFDMAAEAQPSPTRPARHKEIANARAKLHFGLQKTFKAILQPTA